VPFIDLTEKAIANWDVVKKWLFDKIVAAIAVVLLAPLMALIAIAVKLDSRGPALFRQKRMGFNNEVIDVLKFRTMYVEAESQSGAAQVIRDDPRVTRVGRILRRTSLDELP
jgi:lipopolysaccharide/colanic/teichoic acid biosynthesis glycosyltransferase